MVAILLAGPATASPLADALARHDTAAIEQLRRQRTAIAARCTLGAVHARRGELARAGFYLAGCADAELPVDIASDVAKLARAVAKQLRDSELASIEVLSHPDGLEAESTALPGETFTTPATLWVRPGSYEVRTSHVNPAVTTTVTTKAHARSVVWLDARAAPAAQPRKPTVVSFDDNAVEPTHQGPPPPVKRGSLMSKKLRGEAEPPGTFPELADPLAARAAVRPPRALWLGLRLGGGMFDDGEAAARPGVVLAAVARRAVGDRAVFVAGRIDWSRRGGDTMDPIDAVGGSAGAGVTVLERGSLALAVIGQLRGDLRLASTRAEVAVRRAGLSAAAAIELALPATPLTAGIRFEQAVTELVAHARDRAVLLELGVDWR